MPTNAGHFHSQRHGSAAHQGPWASVCSRPIQWLDNTLPIIFQTSSSAPPRRNHCLVSGPSLLCRLLRPRVRNPRHDTFQDQLLQDLVSYSGSCVACQVCRSLLFSNGAFLVLDRISSDGDLTSPSRLTRNLQGAIALPSLSTCPHLASPRFHSVALGHQHLCVSVSEPSSGLNPVSSGGWFRHALAYRICTMVLIWHILHAMNCR